MILGLDIGKLRPNINSLLWLSPLERVWVVLVVIFGVGYILRMRISYVNRN